MALDSYHRQRPSLYEALVGAGIADRVRAHVRPPGGGFPGGVGGGADAWTVVPRRVGYGLCDRCGAAVGADGAVGEGGVARGRAGFVHDWALLCTQPRGGFLDERSPSC